MRLAKLGLGKRVPLSLLTAVMVVTLVGVPLSGIPDSLASQFAPAGISLDQFGGHPGLKAPATGRFYVKQMSSGGQTRWWFVDPLGNAYYANGVSLVNALGLRDVNGSNPYLATLKSKYGNPVNLAVWASDVEDRFHSWGHNAVGGWSSSALFDRLPHTVELSPINAAVQSTRAYNGGLDQYPILYEASEWDSQYRRYFFDVFHPSFQSAAVQHIVSTINANGYADDAYLLGYFIDNEVPFWYGRDRYNPGSPWYTGNTLADVYIALPGSAPGKQDWVSYLQGRYANDVSLLNAAWKTSYPSFDSLLDVTSVPGSGNSARMADKSQFLRRIVGKYFSTVRDALRSVDPNHLYLGARFVTGAAASTPPEVYGEAGKYMDVISTNHYVWQSVSYPEMKIDLDSRFDEVWSNARWGAPDTNAGRPILVTEFSFAARDSGMPATVVNGALVDTQEQRAQLYADFQRVSVESPRVVGHFWWSYYDPPPAGNSWGREDSNLGLVDNSDRPYLRMLYRMYQESPNIFAYRGVAAPARPILSGAYASTTYSNATLGLPSVRTAATSVSAGSSDLHNKIFLPFISRNYLSGVQTTFYFSLISPVDSVTIDIYEGSGASATLKRRLTSNSPLSTGSQSFPWDGLDQNGLSQGKGPYFFVMKVTTSAGTKDYAMGAFTR